MKHLAHLLSTTALLLLMMGNLLEARTQETVASELVEKVTHRERPRLFLDQVALNRLRNRITTTHGRKWQILQNAVAGGLDEAPPDYREPRIGGDSTRPGTLNDEMLWQRQFGYRLPGMALVALLDPDPRYLEAVRRWALKPASYPLWGAGLYENTGLAAKHQLFGLSIAYDWLFDRWSDEDRQSLQRTLREHGRILYEAAEGINDRGWWKYEWRQNHAWNGYQALAVTAIALAGEEPDAGKWLAKALWGGRNIIRELPEEGAYEEGLPYWGYGMEALMRLVEAVRPYSSEDFYDYDYFENTPLFRLYLAGPRLDQIANFGDGLTEDWHAVQTTMYRLASQYRNPVTQWLAEQLPERVDIDAACWGLLWYDPDLEAEPPPEGRLSKAFLETGFAGARTSWAPDAMTVHLRSGVADVSHSHLDVNNFLVNVGGEWLIRDYGYGKVGPGYFNKETIYFSTGTWGHNCLLINGRHQKKDEDSVGRITDAVDRGDLVWWRSDATACYEDARTVVRDLVTVRTSRERAPWGFVVVRDRAGTNHQATFDFLLQPGGRVEIADTSFVIAGERASLAGSVFLPRQPLLALETGPGGNVNVDDSRSLRVSAARRDRDVEFLVVLVPFRQGEARPTIEAVPGGVRVDDIQLLFSNTEKSEPVLSSFRD